MNGSISNTDYKVNAIVLEANALVAVLVISVGTRECLKNILFLYFDYLSMFSAKHSSEVLFFISEVNQK